MKTVFKSTEIAHIWAHKQAPEGRCSANMRFSGDTIYSYGTAIARLIARNGHEAVIYNETSYSNTTSKHQGRIRQAIAGKQIFRIGNLGRGVSLDFYGQEGKMLFEYQISKAARYQKKAERARQNKELWLGYAAGALESARAINEFFGLRRKVDEKTIERLREASAKAEREEKRKQAERDGRDRQEQSTAFELWKLGDNDGGYFNASLFSVAFRIEGEELVSSLGARVPIAEAKRALVFALRHRDSNWHRNGETCLVGHYQLDAINANGIVAGCHRITWEEVERVNQLLSLVTA